MQFYFVNKHIMQKLFLFVAVVSLTGCMIGKSSGPEVLLEEEFVVSSESTQEPEELLVKRPNYHPSETILTDLVHTKLEVNFDWEKTRMNGVASISAHQHFYASDSLILDAKGMDINSVKMDGKNLTYSYDNSFLRINLGRLYNRTEVYTVVIDYVAKPEERESKGSAAITDAKGLYFINPTGNDENKMPQIWTQGETEASSVWFPTIDAPNAKTTQEIFITVDNKYTTLSNGKLVSSKNIENNKRVDHWKQELPHAPYLFMMGIGEFKVVKDSYTRKNGTKMDVHYYVEPEWESSAKAIFGETPEMIRFFSELLGVEYPWDKYHQIVVRDYVSGAMENTGAVIFGDYAYKNERELLDANDQSTIAHELFHHWFGDLVTCESWSNLSLNESFANYSQYLWDEHRYGLDEADYNAEGEADGYYQSAGMQGHHNLIWFDYDDKEQMFDGHSYNKGGRILHMLRNYLGDEAFFAGMNRYLDANKFKPAEYNQLRIAFEDISGEDLNWFFDQWYLASGNPSLDFEQSIDSVNNTVKIIVQQTQDLKDVPLYKLPFDIAVFDATGKHIYPVVVDEVSETIELPFSGQLKGLIFDYEQMILAPKRENKPAEFYIHEYYNGERYSARKMGLMEGSRDKSQLGQQLIIDALNDDFWHIRLLALGKITRLRDANKEAALEKVKVMAINDANSAVRASALSTLEKMLSDEEMEVLYKERIANDLSYSVVNTALRSLGKKNPSEAIALAEGLETEKSSKMVSGIAQLYAGFAGPEKYEFIKNAILGNTVQGFDKLGLLNSLTFYLTRQDVTVVDHAFEVYKDQSEAGSFYMSMFLPQNLTYLDGNFESKIEDLRTELIEHEKVEDHVSANNVRAKIKSYEEVKSKYKALSDALEAEKESAE